MQTAEYSSPWHQSTSLVYWNWLDSIVHWRNANLVRMHLQTKLNILGYVFVLQNLKVDYIMLKNKNKKGKSILLNNLVNSW